ncbi:(2E,6E)-farnesyl diphosphate synthase [Thiogranum longum]|uniref:(2E,6E)-farnesyl diphosphate synthase n=1 Tax=Thiogranum longum TaxID=1537524 RepID=UPI001FB2928E|nr:farnesyl diphosphate synthase [Thiogranum longum]
MSLSKVTQTLTDLDSFLADCQQRVEAALRQFLPDTDTLPTQLHAAMRYAVLDGGKRIRPVLVYAAGHALGARGKQLDVAACAIECIHVYSLIHDDLPAMDDDDLRRGKPSCHKAFGEAEAILAGDALQAQAFYLLSHADMGGIPAPQRLAMIERLALASGSRGMVGGQAIDLAAVGKTLGIAELEDMHIHKTGMLIRAAVLLGALCAENADETLTRALDHYGKYIGLAFQVQDDILDVTGNTEQLGKQAGADRALDKPTYPALLGLAGARERAQELHSAALEALSDLDENADPLRWISQYIVERST